MNALAVRLESKPAVHRPQGSHHAIYLMTTNIMRMMHSMRSLRAGNADADQATPLPAAHCRAVVGASVNRQAPIPLAAGGLEVEFVVCTSRLGPACCQENRVLVPACTMALY